MSDTIARFIWYKFLDILAKHLVEGDRILFEKTERQMYIGKINVSISPDLGTVCRNYPNLHTGGAVYGIKLIGIDHDYHFKLSPKYRKELAKRLFNGQEYY